MIRAIYFDIDGTLVSYRTHVMPESAARALAELREAGVRLILCTGRNYVSAKPLIDTKLFDGEILLNGQYCLLNGECVYENAISKADVAVAARAAKRGDYAIGFVSAYDSFISDIEDPFVLAADRAGGMPVLKGGNPDDALDMDIYQMHYYGAPGGEARLTEAADGLFSVRWSENFADVFRRGGGKDVGMRAINRRIGVADDQTMAFGDGENDVGMLTAAGVGVAMGNAGEFVKSRADYVTDDVDENGIANAIAHFRDRMEGAF